MRLSSSGFFHKSVWSQPPDSHPKTFSNLAAISWSYLRKCVFFMSLSGLQNPESENSPGIVTRKVNIQFLHCFHCPRNGTWTEQNVLDKFSLSGYLNMESKDFPGLATRNVNFAKSVKIFFFYGCKTVKTQFTFKTTSQACM